MLGLGFGGCFPSVLYFLLIYPILKISSYSKDTFGYICRCCCHAVISDTGEHQYDFKHYAGYRNTLPSYGGNAMLVNMLCQDRAQHRYEAA